MSRASDAVDERGTSAPVPIAADVPCAVSCISVNIVVDTLSSSLSETPSFLATFHKQSQTMSTWKHEIGCDVSHKRISSSISYDGTARDMRIIRQPDLLHQSPSTDQIMGYPRLYISNL